MPNSRSSEGEAFLKDNGDPLARARCSLEGLSVGDALGGFFEFAGAHAVKRIAARALPQPPWHYTDDTMMALSIVSALRQRGAIEQDALAQSFAERYERARGYGPATRAVLARIRRGEHWRPAALSLFGGQGSYGNGAAMRVGPIGGYFADNLAAAAEQARRSAEVTHAHPEAIAGAIAVAAAAACAWRLRGRPPPSPRDFLGLLLPLLPPSEVRDAIGRARDLPPAASAQDAAAALGNGTRVSSPDTVPFAVWCAAQHLDDYQEAIWLTASGLGDVDTTCAIVGGIVALYTGVDGIPAAWRQAREPLPDWPFHEQPHL
jgi:ADP-ribosylglycohydrolase